MQNLLHHASPQTTMIYSHMANSTLARASQAVSDVITRATEVALQEETRADDRELAATR